MAKLEKFLKIQNELKAPKNLYNKFGKFNYRSAESILEAVKPICFKYDCLLTISDEIVLVGDRIYVKATATLIDTQTNDTISTIAYAREDAEKKGMDGAQLTGATSSYARKYALNGLFCIDDTKDPDTDEFQAQKKAKTSTQKEEISVDAIRVEIEQTTTKKDLQLVWNKFKERTDIPEYEELKRMISEKNRSLAEIITEK